MLNILTTMKSRLHQALIYISLLIGAWPMIESLTGIYYILTKNRSMTLVGIFLGPLLFGTLFFAAGLFLKFGKKRLAQTIFFVMTFFSIIRWLKYWDAVFPFERPSIYHHNMQSWLDFLWQRQHFAIAMVTLVITLLNQWTSHRHGIK